MYEAALITIQTIAHHLSGEGRSSTPEKWAEDSFGAAWRASLSAGLAGYALFFAYSGHALGNPAYLAQATTFLEQAVDGVADARMSLALHGGGTGVAWVMAHLLGCLIDGDGDEPTEAFDVLLGDYVSRSPWRADFDLFGGLVGFGVYALERLPHPAATIMLEEIVARLTELAVETRHGITWPTLPHLLSAPTLALFPQGYINLGMAHGIPGVIGLLGRICAAGVTSQRAERLLSGAVDWLLQQPITVEGEVGYGVSLPVPPDEPPRLARLAWCYGDPGVAAGLLLAARTVGEPTWEAAALTIARRAVRRPVERAGVQDGCFCHGAAGLGHLFNRIYQATGDPEIGEAARYWFGYTLQLRRPGLPLAGYLTYAGDEQGAPRWVADPGLVNGATGIALALLAAISGIEPLWDRCFLLDIPIRK
jgi:hypothetical protein